jgi:hypothetical protein
MGSPFDTWVVASDALATSRQEIVTLHCLPLDRTSHQTSILLDDEVGLAGSVETPEIDRLEDR